MKAIIAKIKVEMNQNKYPNLKPWKAGQSGNPAGRKVGSKNVSTIIRELLEEDIDSAILTNPNVQRPYIALSSFF
jgi:hypothetical protein